METWSLLLPLYSRLEDTVLLQSNQDDRTICWETNFKECENGEVATSNCVEYLLKLSESLSPHLINQGNNTHGLMKIRLYRACKRAWLIVVKVLVAQSCLNLCDPMDCSRPGSSGLWYSPGKNTEVGCHSLFQGSSWLKDQTQVSCIAGRFITIWATREALIVVDIGQINLGSLSPADHPVLWQSILTAEVHFMLSKANGVLGDRGLSFLFKYIELVMPSNHLILCCPLLLLPSIFPSIRVFSNESALRIRWSKYWSFNFSISPSNEYSGLIFFRIDWFGLLAVQGTLKSLLQHHSSKASILWHSALFMVQLSHLYMTTGKTIALTRWTLLAK